MIFPGIIKPLQSSRAQLVFLWIILTAINLDKAYHIDDTFHLEAASHLQQHPLKPLSGSINWHQSPAPMFEYNQPPLFFYLISLVQLLFGNGEVAMHLLLSVFTFLALYFFSKLSQLLEVKHPRALLTIFAFCPALVVNQNLMTDVPILSLTLGVSYYLLKGHRDRTLQNYVISAVLLSIGLLIKYSLLPVLMAVLLSILLSKDYRKAGVVLIPLAVLGLWSVWNLAEFGSVHMLDRPRSAFHITKLYSFMGTLGAMATFSPVFFYALYPRKVTQKLIYLGFCLFVISAFLVYYGVFNPTKHTGGLHYLFKGTGFLLIILIARNAIRSSLVKRQAYFQSPDFTLALFVLGISAFIILFAPFNATRHVLLIIPFILLLGRKRYEESPLAIKGAVLVSTIALGGLLGVSDWVYADFYRRSAREINMRGGTVWSVGHWGWHWYSQKRGMKIYSQTNEFNVRTGDTVVYPKDVSRQKISPDIQLVTIDQITEAPNLLTFFSGKDFASMYNSFVTKPAWNLSNEPIDTIIVAKVKEEIGVPAVICRIKSDEQWLRSVRDKADKSQVSLDSMLTIEAQQTISQRRNK